METMRMIKIIPEVKYKMTMPFNSICTFMQIAGKQMLVKLVASELPIVQLYRMDGTPFNAPLVPVDAGLLIEDGSFYGVIEE